MPALITYHQCLQFGDGLPIFTLPSNIRPSQILPKALGHESISFVRMMYPVGDPHLSDLEGDTETKDKVCSA